MISIMPTNSVNISQTRRQLPQVSNRYQVAHRIAVLCFLLLEMGCSSKSAPEIPKAESQISKPALVKRDLAVAAAADLKFVLNELVAEFEKQNPFVRVNPTFGASGNLFAQISNRAPFDLFLSADVGYPQQLIAQNLALEESLFKYAIGQIVVWVTKDSPLDVESQGIDVLKDPSVQRVAIANPKHAPYGRAAEAAMKSLGVYDQVGDRLVLGENVAQAVQFVETGAADVGIVSHSLLMAPELRDKGRFWIVPRSAYPPIEQAGVIVAWTKQPESAELFRSFLISEQGRAIFEKFAFQLPPNE